MRLRGGSVGFVVLLSSLGLLSLTDNAEAAPTVVATSTSTYTFSAADFVAVEDHLYSAENPGSDVQVVGPRGDRFEAVHTTASTAPAPSSPALNCGGLTLLDAGVFHIGTASSLRWTAISPLVVQPGDGTWTVSLHSVSGSGERICLHVNGKELGMSVAASTEPSPQCFWNEHTAPSIVTQSQTTTSPNIVAECSDSNNFKFFSDQLGTDPDPQAFTEQGTVACGPPPVLTMNGIWIRGATQAGNTFARFVSIQTFAAAGDTDLRDNPGAVYTTLTDSGAGATGTVTGTTFYNDASGNSYQLLVRAGATGVEQLGNVARSPLNQCALTGAVIALTDVHDEDALDLTASQAQCAGDPISFSYDLNLANALTTIASVNLYIYKGSDGTLVLVLPQSLEFSNGNKVGWWQTVLPAGAYTAIIRLVTGGAVNLGTLYDSAAFSVPAGTCGNTIIDVLTITNNVQNLLNSTTHNINNNSNTTAESAKMNFSGLTSAQSWTLLFWLVVMLWGMKKGWPWIWGTSILGIPTAFLTTYPLSFVGGVMLLVISWSIQYLTSGGKNLDDSMNHVADD